jgi:rhodanese-related sulfurtransferase
MSFGTMVRVGAVLLTLAPAVSRAAAETATGVAVAGVPPGEVDGATARKLVAAGVKVVDVRTPAEFASGHVPGALNIPHDQMAERAGEIGPPSTPVLLYCRTGPRTQAATRALQEKGFTTIYDLKAYSRWVDSEPAK